MSNANHMRIIGSILGWYACSTILVSANKIIFDILDFPIPLLVTFLHFSLTCFVMVIIRNRLPDLIGHTVISRSEFIWAVLPVALCTAGDVGLSNMAYSRLPISVMTVLKSSAPVCIYTAAVVAKIERFQWRLSVLCVCIAVAVAFAMPDSSLDGEVSVVGIVIVSLAMVCLSIRWIFIQSMSRRYTPMQLMYLIQPMSALCLLPFALGFEFSSIDVFSKSTTESALLASCLVLGSAFAAMGLLYFEYRIVHYTTSLSLAIAGIGKEIVTLFLSFLFFDEKFTRKQIICISLSILGILAYSLLRSREGVAKSSFTLKTTHMQLDSPTRTVSVMMNDLSPID